MQVSASFGSDVWDARNFGQVLYAIKTRNGDVFLKFLNRQGDVSILQVNDHRLMVTGQTVDIQALKDVSCICSHLPLLLQQSVCLLLYLLQRSLGLRKQQSCLIFCCPGAELQEQDVDESQAKYLNERDGGNYGYSTKQWQISNYKAKKESEAKRIELFEGALSKFKKSDIEGVSH